MIGRTPTPEELSLTPGQDFTHAVKPPAPFQFQPGTTLKIEIVESQEREAAALASWPAAVDLGQAVWLVQSEVSDLIPVDDGAPWFRLYISYPDSPTTDHCWFSGPVLYSP